MTNTLAGNSIGIETPIDGLSPYSKKTAEQNTSALRATKILSHFTQAESCRNTGSFSRTSAQMRLWLETMARLNLSFGGLAARSYPDSYKGMRYQKEGSTRKQSGGWTPTAVRSLDDAKLPHENGRVATGLYIVPIERDWSIYRFEYQE